MSFGTRRAGTRVLSSVGHPWSVLSISRPYHWMRRAVAPVAAAGRERVRTSHFAGGNWLSLVGGGLFGLGCGRLALVAGLAGGSATGDRATASATMARLGLPILAVVLGALVAAAGPRLMSALGSSVVMRTGWRIGGAVVEGLPAGGGRAPEVRRTSGVRGPAALREAAGAGAGAKRAGVWRDPVAAFGLVLVLAAGLAAGLAGGGEAAMVAGAGALVVIAALVLHRPEVFLLAAAGFPWIDWAARRSLGALGPAWDDAFLLISLVLLVWSVFFLRRAKLWTVPLVLPLLLAFAAALGSVVVNNVPGGVAVFALRVLFQPILFYFLGFLFPKNKRWVQWIVAVFILAGLLLALHGIYQYVTHAPMPASWVDVREGDVGTRAYSIIENPNGLGAFLLIGSLVGLSMALRTGLRPLQRWTMLGACLVQFAGIAVTFSRGAWLGLGVGVVVLLVMGYRRYLVPIIAGGVAGWFALPARFTDRLAFAFSATYVAKSLTAGRLYIWKVALYDVINHPFFGVGLGTFGGTTAVTFGYGKFWVDNFYLQLAAEGGLVLFALFAWVLLRAAKGLVRGYGQTHDPYMRALTSGVFAGFIAVAAANMTASVWETLVVGVGFWFLAGLATSASQQIPEDATSRGAA